MLSEQRVTAVCIHLLIGLSTLLTFILQVSHSFQLIVFSVIIYLLCPAPIGRRH